MEQKNDTDRAVIETAEALLSEVPGAASPEHVARLPGGRNNRVYRVSAGNDRFLLKIYFRHEGDPRDRLGAEFGFLTFAWNAGIRNIPRPAVAWDELGAALYGFVDGRRLNADEVGEGEVRDALGFLRQLNDHRDTPEARTLPHASEACFSKDDHISSIDRRVERLREMPVHDDVSRDARNFAVSELAPLWAEIRSNMTTAWGKADAERRLPGSLRCISPSDFGFHNALLVNGVSLVYIDFEYAGIDDPAKTVCDFFCQPEVPVPEEFLPIFTDGIAAMTGEHAIACRVTALLPAYRVKWACIALNDFMTIDADRRRFSEHGSRDRRASGLAIARKFFSKASESL